MRFYINTEHLRNEIEYPQRYKFENLIKSSVVVFLITLLFLLMFKPFGVYDPELYHGIFSFFFSICAALILFLYPTYQSISFKLWFLKK